MTNACIKDTNESEGTQSQILERRLRWKNADFRVSTICFLKFSLESKTTSVFYGRNWATRAEVQWRKLIKLFWANMLANPDDIAQLAETEEELQSFYMTRCDYTFDKFVLWLNY